jgi:hypothetical protein
MAESLTATELAAIETRHTACLESFTEGDYKRDAIICPSCVQNGIPDGDQWPCDVARLLIEVRRLRALETAVDELRVLLAERGA